MARSAVHLLDELCQGDTSLLSTVDLIGLRRSREGALLVVGGIS